MKVVLSYGMGVESSALLLRWLEEPATCGFDLERDLIVITSQTGGEYPDTKVLCEMHILPRLRQRRVRFVQVARAGHLEADGIVVLSDTREPNELYIGGAYTLYEELREAGTVPQFSGARRCSLKFKAWVIETWLAQQMEEEPFRHAFGFNAEEQARIAKSEAALAERIVEPVRVAFGFNCDEQARIVKAIQYDTPQRQGWYPLAEWGWSRARCSEYLQSITGTVWEKSACIYCPFNALKADAIERLRQFPAQVAQALLLEHQSLALNPRGSLYRDRTLYSLVVEHQLDEALRCFRRQLSAADYALYRVRRIYSAPGAAHRAVEKLLIGSRAKLERQFARQSAQGSVRSEHGFRYGFVRERVSGCYPTVEEFFVVAPADVDSKTHHGFAWFEARWQTVIGESPQVRLFE